MKIVCVSFLVGGVLFYLLAFYRRHFALVGIMAVAYSFALAGNFGLIRGGTLSVYYLPVLFVVSCAGGIGIRANLGLGKRVGYNLFAVVIANAVGFSFFHPNKNNLELNLLILGMLFFPSVLYVATIGIPVLWKKRD